MPRLTCPQFKELKGQRKLVTLSLGLAGMARMADKVADLLLVGDSINMTLYGQPSTRGITLDQMIAHGRAVVQASENAIVVVDLPFGTYEQSPAQAFASASRVLAESGCQGVKLEGGLPLTPTIEFLVQRGIPVMGHVGLYPQHSEIVGGFKKERDGGKVIAEAKAQEAAGVFSMVVEAVPPEIGTQVTKAVDVPVIGIAAGEETNGQILVVDDLVGMNPGGAPKFVEQRAQVHRSISRAFREYAKAVRGED